MQRYLLGYLQNSNHYCNSYSQHIVFCEYRMNLMYSICFSFQQLHILLYTVIIIIIVLFRMKQHNIIIQMSIKNINNISASVFSSVQADLAPFVLLFFFSS